MTWTKTLPLLLAVTALVGCGSNAEMEQKLRVQDAKIKSLSNDNNLLADQNRALQGERDVYKARYQATQSTVNGLQSQLQTTSELVRSKDAQVARERQIAAEARADAKAAKLAAAKTIVNVPQYGGAQTAAHVPAGSQGSLTGSGSSSSGKGKYHLRIISLPGGSRNEKTIREMESYLKSKGIRDVVARKSGSYWVIDIGHFNSIRSSDATALKTRIRGMRYKGIRQFSSAYFAQY